MQLQELASHFDQRYPQSRLNKAEQVHQELLEKFPREKLKAMALEEYALGRTKRDSFCWWLEYNTSELGGIKGGSANKHIIYFSKKHQEWRFPDQFDTVEQAWLALRDDIVELIGAYDYVEPDTLSEDNLLQNANMLKGKILFVYHPEKFIPFYNKEHLHAVLKALNVPETQWKGKDTVECNLLARKHLNDQEPFREWSPIKIGRFFVEYVMKEETYLKVAPGENANQWLQCLEEGIISIGWNEVGDITQYPDYEEFKSAFIEKVPLADNKKVTKANEVWQFYNLKHGDKVIANKGTSKILGIGTVTKGYEYRDDIEPYKHVVYVDWEVVYDNSLSIPKQGYWAMSTVREVSKKEVLKWIGSEKQPGQSASITFTEDEEKFFSKMEKALDRKGQCILYGPPGTGKTYLAKRYIDWKNEKENLLTGQDKSEQQLWMMVASARHTFQWEDILESGGTIDFELKSVQRNFRLAKEGDRVLCYKGGSQERSFVGLAEIVKRFDGEKLIVKGVLSFKQPIPFDDVKDQKEYQQTQAGRMGNRGTMFEINDEFREWIVNYLLEAEDNNAVQYLDDRNQTNIELCTFHPSFTYEDFIEGYKPITNEQGQVMFDLQAGLLKKICQRAEENEDRPYFLIVDEINRGNIPKIFGDMITVMEKDKRGTPLTLPQSKVTFTIPSNVYIIGTMNTSDRSIKMMDAALKRRFAFIECMPNYELLNQFIDHVGLSPKDILQNINDKLTSMGGRDKQIGHAYFMKNGQPISTVADLKEVYELEIIPLIQDYCFNDYEQFADIIGSRFVDTERMEINHEIFNEPDDVFIEAILEYFKVSKT